MANKETSALRPLLNKIYPAGVVMTLVCWLFTLIWGFELKTLLGFLVGCGYMCLCYEYLARVCERAVRLDKKRGGRAVTACYMIRFAGLFALCAAGMLTGYLNFAGILLPQFFPKIILTVMQFTKGRNTDSVSADTSAEKAYPLRKDKFR